MPYFAWEDLTDLIPAEYATQALDDDDDHEPEKWESVQAASDRAVDLLIRPQYTGPIADPPAILRDAAVLECAFACYARRNEAAAFPHMDRLKAIRETLKRIGAGTEALFPTAATRTSAVAITEEARTYSPAGRLAG